MESHIVGGDPIDIELCPSAVLIYNLGSMCAGSILNSYSVLSAAHCFDHNSDVEEISVHVGSQHRRDEKATIHDVMRVVVHVDYNKATAFAADIAIVFLEYAITFGKKAKKYNGPLSEVGLMKTKLRYIPLSECSKLHGIPFSPDMFCLYGDAKHDSCKGDSGGGVIWKGFLVGIVSHGDGCAGKNKPSVYVSTYYYRGWIRKQVLYHVRYYCDHI
ncbi:serine protease 38-like [Hyposmocoma kahamanoa]|uniref:serine protease 38-like n=1 Tax=Hyposmocoma kahamanoa TaxID=1477025 RepID=UPI000E6DA2FD|nr:serine protease 38-like [Hyposmocoma kahamanoa]